MIPVIRIIDENNASPELLNLRKKLIENIVEQSDVWHRTSPKKVAAGVYLKKKNDYIVAQNILCVFQETETLRYSQVCFFVIVYMHICFIF